MIRYTAALPNTILAKAPAKSKKEIFGEIRRDRPRRYQVLDLLVRAAEAGERCPSNRDIAELLDLCRPDHAIRLIRDLAREGKIRVFTFQCGRVVEIIATGKRTAMPANPQPHWRAKRAAQ